MAKRQIKLTIETDGRNPAVTIDRLTPVDTDDLPKRVNLIQIANGKWIGKISLEKGKWHGLIWRIAGNAGATFSLTGNNSTFPGGLPVTGKVVSPDAFAAGFAIFNTDN